MRVDYDAELQVIGEIYDAAIDQSLWPDRLDKLAASMGAVGGTLHAIDAVDPNFFQVTHGCTRYIPEMLQKFNETVGQHEAYAWETLCRMPAGEILTDEDLWPDREAYAERPDIRFMLDLHGVFHRAGTKLNDERAWYDGIVFQLGKDRGPITTPERARLGRYVPHLARAVTLTRSYSLLQARHSAVLGALDHIASPMIVVLGSGYVLYANEAAQTLLDRADGILTGADGRLSTVDASGAAALSRALAAASATATGQPGSAGTRLRLARRGSGKAPYLADISPLRDPRGELQTGLRASLVALIDPDATLSLSAEPFRDIYGLSPGETAVLGLILEGHGREAIAERRNVSPETIKVQTRAILRKTDCTDRVDLLRRALTLRPALR